MTAVPHALDLGDLRRVTPIDAQFGEGRGKPVDRHYIERFLAANAARHPGPRPRGRRADDYTRRFGGNRVTHSDVIHADAGNPKATIVADLAEAHDIPERQLRLLHLHPDPHLHLSRAGRGRDDAPDPAAWRACCWSRCPASARSAPTTATAGESTGASPRSRCAGCCANRFRASTSGSRRTAMSSRPPPSCRGWRSRT